MFKTPYETTTLSNYDVTKIKSTIEQELITSNDTFVSLNTSLNYANEYVLTINNAENNGHIPLFSQPLLVNTQPVRNDNDHNRLIIDCRGFTSISRDGIVSIKKPAQYRNHLIGAALSNYWYFGGESTLMNISKFPTKVFANWVTGTLTNKLNLDELAQVRTSAIVA
jgi:hypothetical protein